MAQKSSVGEMGMISNLRVGKTGVGEMGVDKKGVGEMGIRHSNNSTNCKKNTNELLILNFSQNNIFGKQVNLQSAILHSV